MYKIIFLVLVSISIMSCTNKAYRTRDLGKLGNEYRNHYLEEAFQTHQAIYFDAERFHNKLSELKLKLSANELEALTNDFLKLKTAINKLSIYRYIHGPLDYASPQSKRSIFDFIATKHPDFALQKDKGLEGYIFDKESTMNEMELMKRHLLYSEDDITLGIYAISAILKLQQAEILNGNQPVRKYLDVSTKILKDQVQHLLYTWSPYRSGNFQELVKTRPNKDFYSYLLTGIHQNIHKEMIPNLQLRDQAIGYQQSDLLERFEALQSLWHGTADSNTVSLQSFCHSINKGTCKKITRLLDEQSINLQNADNARATDHYKELSRSFLSFINEMDGDINIQNKFFVKPNNKINRISKQQVKEVKKHIFGAPQAHNPSDSTLNNTTLQ